MKFLHLSLFTKHLCNCSYVNRSEDFGHISEFKQLAYNLIELLRNYQLFLGRDDFNEILCRYYSLIFTLNKDNLKKVFVEKYFLKQNLIRTEMNFHMYRMTNDFSIIGSENTVILNNSNMTNQAFFFLWRSSFYQIGLGLLLLALSLITIFGNVLVIAAVLRERHLQTATNFFITSLALADCLVGLVVMPFSALYEIFEKHWFFSLAWCDVWRSFDVLFSTASILNLCIISVDRYWAIKDPLSYPSRMTRTLARILITFVWVASSLISFPAIIWWRAVRPDRIPPGKCPFTVNLGYILFSSMISFYLPLFIMVFTYYKIYREAVVQTKSLQAGAKNVACSGEHEMVLRMHRGGKYSKKEFSDSFLHRFWKSNSSSKTLQLFVYEKKTKDSSSLKAPTNRNKCYSVFNKNSSVSKKFIKFSKEKKAAKTLGIVMGVFIICWLPFFVVHLWSGVCPKCIRNQELISTAVSWLGWINSGMNPIIYACWSKDFKR